MNEIERVCAILMRAHPSATATLDGPTKGGHWLLEIDHGEVVVIAVWRDGGAFTIAVERKGDDEPTAPETSTSVEHTVERVAECMKAACTCAGRAAD